MSCYFRHLKNILGGAGIEVTPANKKQVDQAIHQIVGITYKNCPDTWKRLKQEILADPAKRQDFVSQLKATL